MSAASHPLTAPVNPQPTLAPKSAPPRPSHGSPWKWLIWSALILIAAFLGYRALNRPAVVTPAMVAKTAKVTAGNLNRTLRVSGQTTAINFANITAPRMQGPDANREMVMLQMAAPGIWVKKGTMIATIDSQSMQDHVDDLGDTIETAQADILKRKAEQAIDWENMEQTLRITKTNVDKARLDYSTAEIRTDIERELLKLALDEADAQYKQTQADLAFKKAGYTADLRILDLTLQRHTRHRDRHANDIKAFTFRAPMDGLVVMSQIFRNNEMSHVQVGDRVFPGQAIMKVVDTTSMQVEGSINQVDSGEFRVGQTARIKFDAFPEMQFEGKVHTLGALAAASMRNSAFIRAVPIRLKIIGSDPKLIPDLSASADVVIEKAENQVIVPRAALSVEDGKTVAYVKKGDTFEKREVSLGLQNDTHAVALAGLTKGEDVRLN